MVRLAVIGDFNPNFESHVATSESVHLAAEFVGSSATVQWLSTTGVTKESLANYDGIWAAPGSPYRSFAGMLSAIQYARERRVPFLGT